MIFIASDLHLGADRAGDSAAAALARSLANAGPRDVLLLAGDLGNSDSAVARGLRLFDSFPGRRLAVAGNHDIWVEEGGDSRARHARFQRLLEDAGFHALERAPLVAEGVGFAGVMGWYDYSFGDPSLRLPRELYRSKRHPDTGQVIWADALRVRLDIDDERFTEEQARLLDAHLGSLKDLREVVVVLHHLPHPGLLARPRFLVPRLWRYCNAFLGSGRFADVVRAHPNVRAVFCGHVHRARRTRDGGVLYASVGGDYRRKQLLMWDGRRLRRRDFAP